MTRPLRRISQRLRGGLAAPDVSKQQIAGPQPPQAQGVSGGWWAAVVSRHQGGSTPRAAKSAGNSSSNSGKAAALRCLLRPVGTRPRRAVLYSTLHTAVQYRLRIPLSPTSKLRAIMTISPAKLPTQGPLTLCPSPDRLFRSPGRRRRRASDGTGKPTAVVDTRQAAAAQALPMTVTSHLPVPSTVSTVSNGQRLPLQQRAEKSRPAAGARCSQIERAMMEWTPRIWNSSRTPTDPGWRVPKMAASPQLSCKDRAKARLTAAGLIGRRPCLLRLALRLASFQVLLARRVYVVPFWDVAWFGRFGIGMQ